jgi:hypothetical protein
MRPPNRSLFALAVGVWSGCVDTSPIVVEERDAGAVTSAACRACIVDEGAPCRAAYDACTAVAKCEPFIACAFERGCFALGALEDRITCGGPCLTDLGIVSTDPALAPIVTLNLCSQAACREACGIE